MKTLAICVYLDSDAPLTLDTKYPGHHLATHQWLLLAPTGSAQSPQPGPWLAQPEDPKFDNHTDHICIYIVDTKATSQWEARFTFEWLYRKETGSWKRYAEAAGRENKSPFFNGVSTDAGLAPNTFQGTSQAQTSPPGLAGEHPTWFFGPYLIGKSTHGATYSFTMEVDSTAGAVATQYYLDPEMDIGPP